MKIHEIKEMKSEEIRQRINDEERNLVDLRFSHQLKQLTNTSKLKIIKRDIARMKSVLRERELVETKSRKNQVKERESA